MPRTFDTTALRRPVTTSEVRSYRRQVLGPEAATWGRDIPLGLFGVFVVALVAVPLCVGRVMVVGFDAPFAGAVAVGVLIFVGGLAVGLFVLLRESGRIDLARDLESWEAGLRCWEFAAANQLEYAPRTDAANHSGIVFKVGHGRLTAQRIWPTSGPYVEVGLHRYAAGHGQDLQHYEWRYIAFPLPGALPYLLLNARRDETIPGDIGEFGVADRIQTLDGVMDEHFTLYCRPVNRVDAFYVLTPDVMALLIDHAPDLDVEVAGDWLFFYSRFRLALLDPDTWARVSVLEDRIVPLISARARSYGYRNS